MPIQQFDTGLKEQQGVKKLEITPEENFNNKTKVRNYLKTIIEGGISKLDQNIENYFDKDVKVNCFHPVNEFEGANNFKEKFWLPLFESFPDIERREQIVIGGTFRDKVQVGSVSMLSGTFKNLFLELSQLIKW